MQTSIANFPTFLPLLCSHLYMDTCFQLFCILLAFSLHLTHAIFTGLSVLRFLVRPSPVSRNPNLCSQTRHHRDELIGV